MLSMGSVLLAAYTTWRWRVYMTRDQRLKAPAVQAVNSRKLVMVEFTAVTRQLIAARLTSLQLTISAN